MSSAGSIDSQSIKTAHQPGPNGFDTGKPVNGRQRPCLVDTLGMIDLEVVKEKGAGFTVLPRRWVVERTFLPDG